MGYPAKSWRSRSQKAYTAASSFASAAAISASTFSPGDRQPSSWTAVVPSTQRYVGVIADQAHEVIAVPVQAPRSE